MRACAIAGCALEGVNSLGVRCRRPSTRALWAPNAGLGLCDVHARQGLVVRLELELAPYTNAIAVELAGDRRVVAFSEAVSQ